jgi:inosose dehydratase
MFVSNLKNIFLFQILVLPLYCFSMQDGQHKVVNQIDSKKVGKMKVGLSSYSFSKALKSGEMDILQVMQWIADNGGEHIEISPSDCFTLTGNDALIESIAKKAKEINLEISSYTIHANFLQDNNAAYEAEIERVFREVDIARKLGVKRMRHDVCKWYVENASEEQFKKDLPTLANACRRIADYAKQFNIITSVENHGIYVQHSHRIRQLIEAVNRENFRTTLDIGNFICVDEDPISAVKHNIKYASHVHVKDFFIKSHNVPDPGEGWTKTPAGNYWRCTIIGHGDLPVAQCLSIIKKSEYDGYITVEFEGMEDCKDGSRIGMANVKKFLAETK